MESLTQKTMKGGGWVFLVRAINWILQFVRTIVLARILSPHDFGLFGIAFLLLNLLDSFSQTGLWQSLIQKTDDINPFLDTVWTLGIIRGIGITLLLFFSAPAAVSFLNAPDAGIFVRFIALAFILQGLSNVGLVYFDKALDYRKYFLLITFGTISELLVTVITALIFKNVWALVIGRLTGELVNCVVSYRLHPFRPKLNFEFSKLTDLFLFGKWIWGSSILIFLTTQADDLLVGKMLGIASLGLYQMAYKFSGLISTEIIFPFLKVTFPAYAKIQTDIPRLKQAYLKVLNIISFLVFFMAALLFVLADHMVFVLLGEKWQSIVAVLRILVFAACGKALNRSLVQLAKALGHPGIQTKSLLLQLAVLALFIYPGARYMGMQGVALAVFFQSIVALPLTLSMVLPKINLNIVSFFIPILKHCILASITGLLLYFIQRQLPYGILPLCAEIILALIFYLGISRIFCRDIFEYMSIFKKTGLLSHG